MIVEDLARIEEKVDALLRQVERLEAAQKPPPIGGNGVVLVAMNGTMVLAGEKAS